LRSAGRAAEAARTATVEIRAVRPSSRRLASCSTGRMAFRSPRPRTLAVVASCSIIAACGGGGDDGTDPTDVRFGDTALVVVVNPLVNDPNDRAVPVPGASRDGIELATDDGVTATTAADGIAVLAPLAAGARTITVTGGGIDASFTVTMMAGELREVGLAADATRAEIMVELDYKSDRVTELAPTMTNAEVNAALAVSDTVVFFAGGTYQGDIDFSGSRVTLFGEGVLGGRVILDGSITVSGSDSRIRGAQITGDLTVPASGTGLSFSRVAGATSASGSDTTMLANALCGTSTLTGSGSIIVGNAGVAPAPACM
jgi:hypothetical protein